MAHGMEVKVVGVYPESPEKVLKKRVLEVLSEEKKPSYKAIPVQRSDSTDCVSKEDEILITRGHLSNESQVERKPSYKAIPVQHSDSTDCVSKEDEILITRGHVSNESQKDIALVKAGCPEVVVVVESLLLLQEHYDKEFFNLGRMPVYAQHVHQVTEFMTKEEKPSFLRFCYGLWKTLVVISGGHQLEEAATMAAKLFVEVGKAVAKAHPCNPGLHLVAEFNMTNLRAWVELYRRTKKGYQQVHLFKFIGNNVKATLSALAVLEYVADKEQYELLRPLLKVAIPHVKVVIADLAKKLRAERLEADHERERLAQMLTLIKPKLEAFHAQEEWGSDME